MGWPTPQDYNEAIQNPLHCFSNPDLKEGIVEIDSLGLPRATTGAFASVYKVKTGSKRWAVRCFLNNILDRSERYDALTRFVMEDSLDFTVPFEFLEQGIRVQGQWFPIVKMEWVDGLTLDTFVKQNLSNVERLHWISQQFVDVISGLRNFGVAHGDLQHGNIIITPSGIRLVDYDGMFVPELSGMDSHEVGHRNYQHPARDSEHFGPELDNFSTWVIYCSLRILAAEPMALGRLIEEQEGLVFSRQDFLDPRNSTNFRFLEQHESPEVSRHARLLRSMLEHPCLSVPPLSRGLSQDSFAPDSLDSLVPLGREEYAALKASMLVKRAMIVVPQLPPEVSNAMPLAIVEPGGNAPDWAVDDGEDEVYMLASGAGQVSIAEDPNSDLIYRYLSEQAAAFKNLGGFRNSVFAWQEILAIVAVFMFWSVTHVGSTSNIPVIAAAGIAAAWIQRVVHQRNVIKDRLKKLKRSRDLLSEGTSIVVKFYLVDYRPEREVDRFFPKAESAAKESPYVQLKEERCPVELVASVMKVRNWQQLSREDLQSISWNRETPSQGYLYYFREGFEPLLLVTDRNIPLWFV